MRGHSWRKLTRLRASQVPGRKKAGGREGQDFSLKSKLTASTERRDSYHRSGDLPSR